MIEKSARFVVLSLLVSAALGAQDRPRVGLVLSGGGARGAAHVGVLEVLEELRVPIDAIAGTSMGAVVGGLYASGMTPAEIGAALTEADWAEAFRDAALRKKSSFRRKQDDQGLLARPQVGIRDRRVRVPRGLVQGQNLEFLLRSLALPAARVDDFDQLTIPFRAVAADLATGEAVILSSGDLVTAMRASMAIPGAFAPVEREGRLLVDGGVAENLPVEVARAMGVDVVIAVDISAPLYTLDKLDNPAVIADQMLTILMRRTTEERLSGLTLHDIGLVPKLDGFTSASFARAAEMIAIGHATACEHRAQLARWSISEGEWSARQAARNSLARERPRIDEIRLTTDGRLANALTSRLATRAGEALDLTRLHDDLERIQGLGLFDQVAFSLRDVAGRTILGIEARERSWGPNYLRFGLGLRDDFAGTTGWDFGLRYTATGVNSWGAEWRTDVRFGETQALATELYQPLLPQRSRRRLARGLFLSPRFERRHQNYEISQGDELRTRYRLRSTLAAFDLGYELGSRGEIRIGLERERVFSELKLGPPSGLAREVEDARAFVRLDLDELDSVTFPTDGYAGSLVYAQSFRGLGGEFERSRTTLEVLSARPLGNFAVASGLTLGSTFDESESRVVAVPPFALGGLFRLSGLRGGERQGDHVALARAIAYRRASAIGQKLYLGTSLEWGNVFAERDDFDLHELLWNGSLFVGADTFLGPIYLGAGFGEGGRRNYYFVLGRTF